MRNVLLILACGTQFVAARDLRAKNAEHQKLEVDSNSKAEHIVHLSSGEHHDSLARDYPNALAIRHLPSVQALVLDLAPAEAAALKRDHRVRAVAKAGTVSLPDAPSPSLARRLNDAIQNATDVGALVGGRAGEYWFDRSHSLGEPWNLDRINGRGLDGDADFKTMGRGTNIFVLDTGLDASHIEFQGMDREVENVADFTTSPRWGNKAEWNWRSSVSASIKANTDFDGHGTHCAATAAGSNYGVAPGANLYGMRVLGDGGTGSTGGILAALDSVAAVVSDGRLEGPTVVSMSLGGPCQSRDVTFCAERSFYANAISDLRSMGVLVVVAAGNDGADACRTEPAAARQAITVGAIQRGDRIASYSNWGSCVDIMAPGSSIPSANTDREQGNEAFLDDEFEEYKISSGTSQACPLVAGALALYLQVLDGDTEAAVAAMNNQAEIINTNSRSSCPTNRRLVKAPGTTDADDLDVSRGAEHPCALPGQAPRPTQKPTGAPASCGFLVPISASECPTRVDLAPCTAVACGELCEGDGECGTNQELNNCDGIDGVGGDIYRKFCSQQNVPTTARPTSRPTERPVSSPTAKPSRNQMCTDEWDPVCGADGQTYSNGCFAAAAGVGSYVKGECAPSDDVRIENPDLAAPGFNEGDEGTTDDATRLAAAGILSAVVLFLV